MAWRNKLSIPKWRRLFGIFAMFQNMWFSFDLNVLKLGNASNSDVPFHFFIIN